MKILNLNAGKNLNIALIFIFIALFCCANVFGQSITWQRIIYNNYGGVNKILQTSDGGFAATGSIRIGIEWKIKLIKLDIFGNTQWEKIYGYGDAYTRWAEETNDNGFIIGGYSDSTIGGSKFYIIKTDSLGNIEWQRFYGRSELDQCNCIKQTTDGGFILGGRTQIGIINAVWLIKIDSLGIIQWQKMFSTFPKHFYLKEIENIQNAYVICGSIAGNTIGSSDIYLMKVTQSGDSIWSRTYGGVKTDISNSFCYIENSSFLIAGFSNSFHTNNFESYLIKTDTSGNLRWQFTYSGLYSEECRSVKYKLGVGYILTGYADTANTQQTRALIKAVDTNGNLIKQVTFFPAQNGGWFNDIDLTLDGGYIMGGTADLNTTSTMYVVKTDSLLYAEPIGIIGANNNIPLKFDISQNFPNPFNPITTINIYLKESAFLNVKVYDITGKEVLEILEKFYIAGNHKLSLNFEELNLSSGIYFYSIYLNNAANKIISKKMIYLK